MTTFAPRSLLAPSRLSLAARAVLLGLILFCEKFALTFLVDYNAVVAAPGFGVLVRISQHFGFRFALACGVSLALFSYVRGDHKTLSALNAAAAGISIGCRWLVAHALSIMLLALLTFHIYGRDSVPAAFALLVGVWVLVALVGIGTLFMALAPWHIWYRSAKSLGSSWLFAALAAVVAVSIMPLTQSLWVPTASVTFQLVSHLLSPLIPSLHAEPHLRILSTTRFSVRISPLCSGLEGVGLLLAFCGAWLFCLRKEFAFPRALLLLPIAAALSFAVNVIRIAALMLIGYSGLPDVAIYGFHSEAGWIAFCASAALIVVVSQRTPWLYRASSANIRQEPRLIERTRSSARHSSQLSERNVTAVYLLPFLLFIGADMLVRAISSGFENFYILSPLGAGIALIYGWPKLRSLNWHCSWRGVVAGATAFLAWPEVAHLFSSTHAMPAALASMSTLARTLWLVVRVSTAVVIIPVAEELAFRGYMMRRLIASDFESVSYRQIGVTAVFVSSLLFGAENGSLWLAGLLAGLVYAALLIKTGKMGEAVLAHATTNGLLAIYALHWHQWQLL